MFKRRSWNKHLGEKCGTKANEKETLDHVWSQPDPFGTRVGPT